MKIAIDKEGNKFMIKKETHTHHGVIKEEDIDENKVISNTGYKFRVVEASYSDLIHFIKRGPQIITLKDASLIGSYLNLKPDYTVVDIGTGSGMLAIHLATRVPNGKVITYEKRKDFAKIAKKNIELFGIKNIEIKIKDATEGIDEKADAISVDIPEPWKLNFDRLKYGKYACIYLPTAEQVIKFRDSTNLYIEKIVEIKEREFKVRPLRPINTQLDFTAYIVVARKL